MNVAAALLGIGAIGLLYLWWRAARRPSAWLSDDAQRQVHQEWRRPPRVPLAVSVEITAHQRTVAAQSKNIAIGGMLLTPDKRLFAGEPVEVSFVLPDGPAIRIPGAVCRLQAADAAIRFDATDAQRFLVGSWVDARVAKH
ncbi:MAG: PilZ domain-containing protein [Terriglobales bacterium]